LRNSKGILHIKERDTLSFPFFIAKIISIFSHCFLCLVSEDFENTPWHFGIMAQLT